MLLFRTGLNKLRDPVVSSIRAAACTLFAVLIGLGPVYGQGLRGSSPADTGAVADSLWQLSLDPIVVTATRSERAADEVSVPVSVIGQEEIESRGAARLSDLLSVEPGLTVSSDHGSSLQMRGLGPEYTLILLDGEPVVGRTAGTFDLEAFRVDR